MPTLLYSGNLGIGQDLATVLRATARLNGGADLRILVVGGGKGLPSVKALADQLQLPRIEFRSPVPLYKLPDLLAEGDIHLVCQKPGTEGLLVPSKIYGTLAAARPTLFVGPSNCEVAQIVRDSRSGVVVEPGDIEATEAALRSLIQSAAAREEMGVNARECYESFFGKDRSVSRLVDIFEAVGNVAQGREENALSDVACPDAPGGPRFRRKIAAACGTAFQRKRLALALVGTLAVLVLTHLPPDYMPLAFRGGLYDKLQHAVAYSLITLLFLLSLARPLRWSWVVWVLLGICSVAGFDEVSQPLVNRHASVLDFAADVMGIVILSAVFLAAMAAKWLARRPRATVIETRRGAC